MSAGRWSCVPSEVSWEPLEHFVALPIVAAAGLDASDFMWMGSVALEAGGTVQLYKHVGTRRYLRLDAVGVALDREYRPHRSALDAVASVGWFA